MDAQADQDLCCPCMPKELFLHGTAHMVHVYVKDSLHDAALQRKAKICPNYPEGNLFFIHIMVFAFHYVFQA